MSKNINVNPGNYKVAGRERQGEDVLHEAQKQTYARRRVETAGRTGKNRAAPRSPSPRTTRRAR
jgi:hypothetical protein